ncbi:MAG: Gfo/Idh/MocA family oxidoreductase [Deltaproteobacteria bacterium]|nr:Gfo/Idh/MocA family oxidoreductase [Deltaproteobacteria bacterium]
MEKRTLRVGFVGSGFIAQFHAQAMLQVRDVELSGIVESRGARRLSGWAQDQGLGPATLYKTVSELAKNVDIVAIYSPNHTRLDVMDELALARRSGAGVTGVICDKPLGRNMREAKAMVQAAKDAGLKTAYFENQIHMKAVQSQRAQLAPQIRQMGPLSLVRSAEEHGGPHQAWFWDPTRQGGGVLSDMGCHSIAVAWYMLTPPTEKLTFLVPQSVTCDVGLLKWGRKSAREALLEKFGVDYSKTPAEDFATGTITFKNPDTNQLVKAQFTDSWMFEKQGLRIFMDGMGPGYAFEINTLNSPLTLFVGDEAGGAVANSDVALEKATASRGLMNVHYNEADLYGYVDENLNAFQQFRRGQDGLLSFSYGLEVTRLVMAAYLSAERRKTIDLTPDMLRELDTYTPLIQQGKGAEVLL